MNSNYLKYAIGEIILVVIGIFIAIQLNGWYEFKKERNEEQFYLENLKSDLNSDIDRANEQIVGLDSYHRNLRQMIDDFEIGKPKFSVHIGLSTAGLASMANETATWDNLISTGKIEIINNKKIIEAIYGYHNTFENKTEEIMNSMAVYSRSQIVPFLMSFDDYSFLPDGDIFNKYPLQQKSPKAYFSQVEFRNHIRIRLNLISVLKKRYGDNAQSARKVIDLIEGNN